MITNLDKLEQVFDTLACQQVDLLFQYKNTEAQDLEDAIKYVRYATVFVNKDKLLSHFRVFGTRNWYTLEEMLEDFIGDHTYISHHLGIAVRKFNGRYYAVKIKDPDSCFSGILVTDTPSDYLVHCPFGSIICSEYPEIVMLKVIENYENQENNLMQEV